MAKFYRAVGNKYCIFPVGSIYLTVVNVNPTKWYGGTWVKVSGGFLYGCISSVEDVLATSNGHYTKASTGSTGGSSASNTGSHTLTAAQSGLPSHSHGLGNQNGNAPSAIWVCRSEKGWYGNITTSAAGGWSAEEGHSHSMSHTHSLNSHTHAMNYIGVWVWKRTA